MRKLGNAKWSFHKIRVARHTSHRILGNPLIVFGWGLEVGGPDKPFEKHLELLGLRDTLQSLKKHSKPSLVGLYKRP